MTGIRHRRQFLNISFASANILNGLPPAPRKPRTSDCYRRNQEFPLRNSHMALPLPNTRQPTEQPPLNPKSASFCSPRLSDAASYSGPAADSFAEPGLLLSPVFCLLPSVSCSLGPAIMRFCA